MHKKAGGFGRLASRWGAGASPRQRGACALPPDHTADENSAMLGGMIATPHLLIVDDDDDIRSLLTEFFHKHAFGVSVAADGVGLFAALARQRPDLVILDVMLQGEDGFELCRRLRAQSDVPVIMLTAMGDHTDKVVGLEVGADDYVTKPFNQRELLARVKAVLRRAGDTQALPEGAVGAAVAPISVVAPVSNTLAFGHWTVDLTRRELLAHGQTLVFLTAGEFDLLMAFVEHPQRVLSRDQLLDARGLSHGGPGDAPYDRAIDVQVGRLRRKLGDDPRNPSIIRTIRNGGYLFSLAVTR